MGPQPPRPGTAAFPPLKFLAPTLNLLVQFHEESGPLLAVEQISHWWRILGAMGVSVKFYPKKSNKKGKPCIDLILMNRN